VSQWAWGYAVATVGRAGTPLCYYFSDPQLGVPDGAGDTEPDVRDEYEDAIRGVIVRSRVRVTADLDAPPADVGDAYLRLHLLSHRLARPNSVNLDGIFKVLPNVCWTSLGPVEVSEIGAVRERALGRGLYLDVRSVDKFPPMLDFVVPSGVRVADAARVRLGAHLAEGTTVMHEGFVNFNAGTLGPAMVEGRISQGVVVDADSDIGGGASIQGTLSGGGTEVISVGRRCLLGANSGIGVSLGDDCIVESGLYLTAGTIVTLPGGRQAKARELSGSSGLVFRRNSVTGTVEAVTRPGKQVSLSSDLHSAQ
jgi:2,3,4,5-tetrahydropyridine-2-carboxylate N-succinyltransferase